MAALSVLKQRRRALNMTQSQIAKSIGVSQPTYQNYEAGTISIPPPKLKLLARALKIGADEVTDKPIAEPYVYATRASHQVYAVKECDDEPDDFDRTDYYGEVVIHFVTGKPIVLRIAYGEYKRLQYDLFDTERKFFTVYSLSNQIVAVRRAAVTDISFTPDDSIDLGFEHEIYDDEGESELLSDVWSHDDDYWDIVDAVTDASGLDRDDVVDKYGEARVLEVERDVGVLMPYEIDHLIASGQLPADKRQAELDRCKKRVLMARSLATAIKWRLSNGKVRIETLDDDADLVDFWWIADCASDHEIKFRGADFQLYWINPEALDYISIPAHKFHVENKKANDADMRAYDEATAKKKKDKRRGVRNKSKD